LFVSSGGRDDDGEDIWTLTTRRRSDDLPDAPSPTRPALHCGRPRLQRSTFLVTLSTQVAEGRVHDGAGIVWAGRPVMTIDVAKYANSHFTSYGQTRIQEDLYAAADERGAQILFEAADVELQGLVTDRPSVTCVVDGAPVRVEADFIVGCDGFHGASASSNGRCTVPA
jgi:hypothetical protein